MGSSLLWEIWVVDFFPRTEPVLLNRFINSPGKRSREFKFQIYSWNEKCQVYDNKLAGKFQCGQE